jgi:hypothetical protein
VDRYVGLSIEQRSLDLHGEDSLTTQSRKISLQVSIAARIDEDQFTLDPVIRQALLHDVRLHQS